MHVLLKNDNTLTKNDKVRDMENDNALTKSWQPSATQYKHNSKDPDCYSYSKLNTAEFDPWCLCFCL